MGKLLLFMTVLFGACIYMVWLLPLSSEAVKIALTVGVVVLFANLLWGLRDAYE